jgi:cyclophilin family peptidyl-prolyl cis-trans isomerase
LAKYENLFMNKGIIIFLGITFLGFLGIYMTTRQNPNEGQEASNFLTPTPTPTISLNSPTSTPSANQAQQAQAERAIIKTSKGNIVIKLFSDIAPKTVTNFTQKSRSGFYNNLIFHRVEDWVIQGGDPLGSGTGGQDNLDTELSDRPFAIGAVGVARKPNNVAISNDAQFFITKTDAQFLNGQYTNFGQVEEGMEVVNNIQVGDTILGIELQ